MVMIGDRVRFTGSSKSELTLSDDTGVVTRADLLFPYLGYWVVQLDVPVRAAEVIRGVVKTITLLEVIEHEKNLEVIGG